MKTINLNHGPSITYNKNGVYSIGLLPKLIELMKHTKLGQSNISKRFSQSKYYLKTSNGSTEYVIDQLHKRGLKENFFTITQIGNALDKIYNKKRDIYLKNPDRLKANTEQIEDALSEIATNILGVLTLIKTNHITEGVDLDLARKYLNKLSNYDHTKSATWEEFLDKYFFADIFNTPFMNALQIAKGYVKINRKLVNPNISLEAFCRENKEGEVFEACFHELRPLQAELGFDISEVEQFLQQWNSLNNETKINLIYTAIKQSENENLRTLNIDKNIIARQLDKITEEINKAHYYLVLLKNKSSTEADVKKYTKEITNLLSHNFIFQELIRDLPSGNIEQFVSQESILDYTRKMMDDIRTKNIPIYQSKAIYQDPFNIRSIINSSDLDLAFKNPSLILSNYNVRKSFIIYIIGIALLSTDIIYRHTKGTKGKKRKEETFDYLAFQAIDKEVTRLLGSIFDPDKIEKLIKLIKIYYVNEATKEQMKGYKQFLNLVHRDLATTHAIYEMGWQWGSLTEEQINEISEKILKAIYPMVEELHSRRIFRVINDKSMTDRQRSTIITENLDENAILSLIKKEIYNKNKVISYQLALKQKPTDQNIDINDIIKNLQLKLSQIGIGFSDIETPEHNYTTASGVHRGFIRTSNIQLNYNNTIDDIYLKWITNH